METLPYMSSGCQTRWSRQAIWSLAMGILGAPLFIGFLAVMAFLHLDSRGDIILAFMALVALPLTGIGLALASSVRIAASGGALRGHRLATAGAIASLLWPLAIVIYTVNYISLC